MKKVILSTILIMTLMANAESLFSLNATQSAMIEPKPLFSSVRARNVGDLVSIILEEAINTQDAGSYSTEKYSSVAKNLTKFSSIISKKDLAAAIDGANDGTLSADNATSVTRNFSINDRVTAQVVQVLPNGNLLVQGKKSLVQQNERLDLIISGIVDPKWINQSGEISSRHVGNLQFAASGSGTVSRGQNEGAVNKILRTLF